nr:VOC family protein [Kineosporia sp. A_224]
MEDSGAASASRRHDDRLRPGTSDATGRARGAARCGFLGELACDGTRAVGVFWSEALGWPLVWDQDEETAVQSPHGGTKVAWGGPPVAPKVVRNRQRFELAVVDGDPDGNEFCPSAG